ncbi:tumor necrosis factor receptor superfamily member 5 [Mantella aurantiaca]
MSRWILLLVLCGCCSQSEAVSCGIAEYEKQGRCCSLCRPGQRLEEECTESRDTACVTCDPGEYHDTWNRQTRCLHHQYCDQNLGFQMISEGTVERNVDCVCQDGTHCSSTQCETCVENTPCGPGYGVAQKAGRNSDTECTLCPGGTFSNVTSHTEPCKDWHRCSDSQQEIRPGSPHADVVCGPHPKNRTWIYIVLVLIVLITGSAIFFFIRKKRRGKQTTVKQPIPDSPQKAPEVELLSFREPNLPEEDQDDQDITMQGLPVAQEQGKDYHMSQEEV